MGIKNLKTILQNFCEDYSQTRDLKYYKGKILAVDCSIFIYKSLYNNSDVLDGMTRNILRFLKNGIIPYFVFDGKPPKEKIDEIERRHNQKKEFEKRYDYLHKSLKKETNDEVKNQITEEMDYLQKQFVKITSSDYKNVKELITGFGMKYIVSPTEAEHLCCFLAINGIVDYCLSEDSDMFVYGCPNTLKFISLVNHSVIHYNYNNILDNLNLTDEEFKILCLTSKNDYNNSHNHIISNFNKWLMYKSYKPSAHLFEYILKEYKTLNFEEIINLKNVYSFKDYKNEYEKYKVIEYKNEFIDIEKIKNIMDNENFIFI